MNLVSKLVACTILTAGSLGMLPSDARAQGRLSDLLGFSGAVNQDDDVLGALGNLNGTIEDANTSSTSSASGAGGASGGVTSSTGGGCPPPKFHHCSAAITPPSSHTGCNPMPCLADRAGSACVTINITIRIIVN